jgi:CTP:molybdopterin cytidylyltransferase MocA
MTIKPTLLVLAAGMGSRYGGLKQLDVMGLGNETILLIIPSTMPFGQDLAG